MRVISGTAKRCKLDTLEGFDTRPTTDRIKETLFNIIAPYIVDCQFLDLFSGSGAIGIEALSRGAEEVVLVENSPQAAACIRSNLERTRLLDNAVLMTKDVFLALQHLNGRQRFDYIYMDPPYHQQLEKRVLEYLAESDLLKEDGTIIVEAAKDTDFSYLKDWGFCLMKRKEYKTNMHIFVGRERKELIC